MHLLEIVGLSEIDFDICLDNTYLVVRFAVDDINQIVLPAMMNIDCVALHQARVVGELVLQDGLRVSQVNEGGLMRLKDHELALGELDIAEHHVSALLKEEVVHHPYG